MTAEQTGPAAVLIVTGTPAAGKSTVSRLVARRLPRSAVLNGDQINALVVNGRVWALGEPREEAARQVELCNRNLCDLAANFWDAGFTPVIDWVIPDRAQLRTFLDSLAPRPVSVVVLSPPGAVCRTRNRDRAEDEQVAFDDYEQLVDSMRAEYGDLGWWLDTRDLTPEQTAAAVVSDYAARTVSGSR